MSTHYQKLLMQIAELRRVVGSMVRVGTVHEVKGDKLRMNLGNDREGKPVLSPWIHHTNHRGGARERRFFKKGQNVTLISPNGDPRQGIVMPYAPNKNFLPPDHANKSGQDEEVYQLDSLRVKKTKDGYDIWLQMPASTNIEEGKPPVGPQSINQMLQKIDSGEIQPVDLSLPGMYSGSQLAKDTGIGDIGKTELAALPDNDDSNGQAKMKIRINNNGGVTGRVGRNRFSAHSKGAKIKAGKDYLVVTPGKIISSREIVIDKDPVPDDDK